MKKITLTGILLAMTVALAAFEHTLPPVPFFPPGAKLGLSNIVVMYGVFFCGRADAVFLAAGKAAFVFVIRGTVASLLSFCGGFLSVGIIILLVVIFGKKISYIAVSVAGALAHNIGQLAACAALLRTAGLIFYLPLLTVFGVFTGAATGLLLGFLCNALKKINLHKGSHEQ
ncbi:MAG: Gx transporter family protein [Defluviitaleaceae bacterium]|nr:Gx transporter family protein [Defluviitaleaceae bacterium]